jgi:hypothetical protein
MTTRPVRRRSSGFLVRYGRVIRFLLLHGASRWVFVASGAPIYLITAIQSSVNFKAEQRIAVPESPLENAYKVSADSSTESCRGFSAVDPLRFCLYHVAQSLQSGAQCRVVLTEFRSFARCGQ